MCYAYLILIAALLLPFAAFSMNIKHDLDIFKVENIFHSLYNICDRVITTSSVNCDKIILKNKDTLIVKITRIDNDVIGYFLCGTKDSAKTISKKEVYAVKYANDNRVYYNNEHYGFGNDNAFDWGEHLNPNNFPEKTLVRDTLKNKNFLSRSAFFTGTLIYVPPAYNFVEGTTGPVYGAALGFIYNLYSKNTYYWSKPSKNLFQSFLSVAYIFDESVNVSYYSFERFSKKESLLNIYLSDKNGFAKRKGKPFPLYVPIDVGMSYLDAGENKAITWCFSTGLGLDIRADKFALFFKCMPAYILEYESFYLQFMIGVKL